VRRAAASIATAVLILLASSRAYAAEQASVDAEPEEEEQEDFFDTHGNLRTRAETVSFDAREQVLELSGNVRVDSPPFHLRAQRIKLTRTRLGIEVEGTGRLADVPCLGTPLTRDFESAHISKALPQTGGRPTQAARLLGIRRHTLLREVTELTLEP